MTPAEPSERVQELLRLQRERARLTRYLNSGGVLVREAVGGAIGVRWARATRDGPDFDAGVCEAHLAGGRLRKVAKGYAAFGAAGRVWRRAPFVLRGGAPARAV